MCRLPSFYEVDEKAHKAAVAILSEAMTDYEKHGDIHLRQFCLALRDAIIKYESALKFDRASHADILKYLMEVNNLKQKDLSEIGKQPNISKILKGERSLSAVQIAKICKRFNLSPEAFI